MSPNKGNRRGSLDDKVIRAGNKMRDHRREPGVGRTLARRRKTPGQRSANAWHSRRFSLVSLVLCMGNPSSPAPQIIPPRWGCILPGVTSAFSSLVSQVTFWGPVDAIFAAGVIAEGGGEVHENNPCCTRSTKYNCLLCNFKMGPKMVYSSRLYIMTDLLID